MGTCIADLLVWTLIRILAYSYSYWRKRKICFISFFSKISVEKQVCWIHIYSTVVIPPHFQMTSMNGYTGIQKTEVHITFCFWQFCAPLYSSSLKFVFGMTSAHEGSWRFFCRHINMIRSCVWWIRYIEWVCAISFSGSEVNITSCNCNVKCFYLTFISLPCQKDPHF